MNKEIINGEDVEQLIKSKIYVIRGQKVMLDFDIAELYDVQTSRLNEQVRRNIDRFPIDFAFQLNDDEFKSLMSQIAISKIGRGGRRKMPYAFTEHGVAMLSSVLNSKEAIQMNILIIRIFIKVKEWILSNKDLEIKVEKIEKKQKEQGDLLNNVNSVLTQLVEKPGKKTSKIGFNTITK
jgi:hypothetical protein